MKRLSLILAFALTFAACKDSSGPGDGGVARTIGQRCTGEQTDRASLSGNDWRVTLFTTTTTSRQVTGSDGIVRTQTVYGCQQSSCTFSGAGQSMTASEAIAECRFILDDRRRA